MKTFKQYFRESIVKPTTKKFKFFSDNPGGEWLVHEQNRAKKSKFGGAVTAGFHDAFQVPTKLTKGMEGLEDEHLTRNLSQDDVKKLRAAVKDEGIYSAIFINVQWDGKPMINEGNRRALVARDLGLKTIPIELKYYAGGELVDGPWHPDRISKVGKPWKKPKKPPSILRAEKDWEIRKAASKKADKEKREKQATKKSKPVDPEMQKILDLIFSR